MCIRDRPHNGLDTVFGAREFDVEFMPDIGDRIRFSLDGASVGGGGFLQSYTATTGKPRGTFDDGRLAVVENAHGKGRTLLVGTHPGVAYFKTSSPENLSYFKTVYDWTGRKPQVTTGNANVIARLHKGSSGGALYVLNPTRSEQKVTIALGAEHKGLRVDGTYWGTAGGSTITVPPRDIVILKLRG